MPTNPANSPELELPILEALAADPSLSQRELAQRAGLSLTRAHFVLKRLVERGLVKVQNAAQSEHKLGYLYLLTPQGIEAKARLTYSFLERTASQYQQMVARVEAALDPAIQRHAGPGKAAVTIVGDGPLAEVVRDLVLMRGDAELSASAASAQVAVLVEPQATCVSHGAELVRLA